MGKNRQGPGRFSDKILPKNIFVTCDHPSAFRKASEVIIASKPEDFETHVREILSVSEQPLTIMLATRGFIPGMNALPYHALRMLLGEYKRTDVEILTIAGPVDPDDLVDSTSINGILAGPANVLHTISDMFNWSPIKSLLSTDPIGVQTADIMARVYSVWVNYKVSSKEITQAAQIGHLMAEASKEAREFALALGASPETFNVGSIPWNATFISVCMDGPWREFGKQLGTAVKKGKDPKVAMKKLDQQWIKDGTKLQALTDIKEAIACAAKRNIDLPVLKEAVITFWTDEQESIKN